MKSFVLALSLLFFGAAMAQQGPCYNHADPDAGIGNYCYCEGNGKCYFDKADTICDPPSSQEVPCPS
ncbi:hypothetical protein NKR19_g5420 [Coniochaeta hoffmannii]|uniref:Uncharacterized protein n=1 Tax=Coniochaeta hoffmannii TaxID=91930 RepID=A0AA38RT89_9PEZI|nr:hypothetical protein NKR19_g5420 [Coniochaeta hoffmannii]